MDCLKKNSWKVSILRIRKYIYGDSGLANDMTHFKMKNYREKWDIIEEIEKRNKAT